MHLSTPIQRVSFFTVLLFLLVVVKAVPLSAGQYSNPLPTCDRIIDQLVDLNKYWHGKVITNPVLLQRKCFENHTDLIQLHLRLVEKELRCTPPEGLSDVQQEKREDALGILRDYWEVKRFPINNNHPGRVVPYFIDDFGTACAVGHLVRETGFEAFAERVQKENNYAYIEDMNYPELGDWATQFGFSEMELRWIQPGYGCWANRSDIFVTNTNSTGVGSLAWAINEANSDLDPNTIRFNLSPGSVIYPTGQLWLDGTCDAIDGSLAVGEQIIIDGSDHVGTSWGIVINGDECDVTNLIIRGYTYTALGIWGTSGVSLQNNILYGNQTGIELANGAEGTSILFNTIGLDENGNNNQPIATEQYGIWVNDANNITINNNVIAGFNELDETGILLDSDSPGANFNICCNKIGTDANATQVLSNHYGLWIGAIKSQVNVFNNVFGANDDSGVVVEGANDVAIYDNYFGLNEQGQLLMPSDTTCIWLGGNASDIDIYGNVMRGDQTPAWSIQVFEASDVRIGNDTEEGENHFVNCWIGVGVNNAADIRYSRNSMSCVEFPIYFVNSPLTEAPLLTAASTTLVSGQASPGAKVDVYSFDPEICTSATCEGNIYLGTTTASASGSWEVNVSIPASFSVTAIATSNNSSSEFSNCLAIQNVNCATPGSGQVLLAGHSYIHIEWDHELMDDCANAYQKRWRPVGESWTTILDTGTFPGTDIGGNCGCPIILVVPPPYPGLFLNQLPPCTTYEVQIRWVNIDENSNVIETGDWSPVTAISTGSCTDSYFNTSCYAVPDRQPCAQIEAFLLNGEFFAGGEDSGECGGAIGDFGYDYYSDVNLDAPSGQVHDLTYYVTNTGQYNESQVTTDFRVKGWIDYNNDGDYEDPNELVFNDVHTSVLDVSQAFTSNLVIPIATTDYNSRLRIVFVESNPITGAIEDPDPCDNYSAGHTREYNISISAEQQPTACGEFNNIACSDWLNEIIVDLEANRCSDFMCTVVGGVAAFSSVKVYETETGDEIVEVYWQECLEAERSLYSCQGELLASCIGLGCEITSLGNLTFQNDIWSCPITLPDCDNTIVFCGLTEQEILCLPWVQERAEQFPEIEEIGLGTYDGEPVILVGHSYCPDGEVCVTPGVVDVYSCEGVYLATYGTIISAFDPDDPFIVSSVIYQLGDALPNCWDIGSNCFQISAAIIQPSCPNQDDGVITTTIFGGSPPYTYQWSTGSDSPNLSGLTPGEYTLTVTDASGCANSTLVGISQHEGDAVALPDGSGQSYESTISFSQFPAGATIQDVSDIVFVDLNMEHSYTGDLDIELICPDGTSSYLLDYPSGLGTTNFGEPYASGPVDGASDDLTPGIPYTYTFVSNTAAGTIPQFDSNAPSYTYTTVPSEQTGLTYTYTDSYIPAGEYEPVESFTNLLGCPLNGDWTLRVTDNLNLDNGWLFGWSIGFANGPQTETITLEDQVCDDGTYLLTASSYSIEPGETITLNYTANPLGGNNLLSLGDGQSISLANTTGSVEVTYDEPGVYRPSLRIDDQTVVRISIQVRSCGWFGCVRGNNSYRESNEEICQLVTGDGKMYLPPALSDRSYYWTSYENIRDFPVSGDAAILEARVKVPASEGGLSCYDPQIVIYGTDGVAIARWMQPNCSYYSGIGAGSTSLSGSTTNLNALTADFNDWRILKIEVENQTIKAFIDDELRYTLAYEGTVGDVIGLRFYAKGSGSIDWMRLYHANGTLVYEEEFSDCNLNNDEGCLVNQELTFIANPTVGQGGTTVQVPITIRGFEDVAGFSHTLNLESNVGTITGITPAAVGPISNPIDGQTTIIAWDDPTGQGLTLPDDEILFYVDVSLNTTMGLCGELSFTNSPLPISAFVWQNSNAIEVTVVTENAPVCTMIDGGETCDDPIPITCGQTLAANSEFGGDMEEVYSCLDNLLNGKEIYFQFENTQAQDVIFTLSGLTSDLELLLLDATCDPMACLRSSDRTGPVDEVIYWENMPVGTYYLVVEGYLEATSSFLLSVECGDIPGGTLSCQDEVLLCDAITSGNNENGSNNVLQYNCGQNDAYVSGPEYVYLIENQTTDSLIYVVTLQDHTADLDLFVLTGCNRNDCFIASTNSGTEEESFILRVNPQDSYRVVIDGYNGAVSAYNLVVDCFPVNEFVDLNCDSSQPITCGEVINSNNVNGNYTGSSYCNGNYTNGPEDIYLFSNPYPQDVTILLSGLSQNLDIYLLDTCSVINSCAGIGDKSGISDEGIIIPNLPAGDYYIVVDGFDNGISDYQLELQCVPREVEKSGRITKVNGDAVQDVLVLCNDDMQTFSNAVGDYEFPPVLVGQDYIIEPHKDVNYRNGVGLIDIIRIRAHILGTTALPSNYHLIAADVSNDAQIDVLDISRLYQLYLFMIDDWPDVESWRFVPQEFEFDPIPANQDVPNFLESIALTALAAPAIDQDFYAVKMGDVTDDAAGDQIVSPPSGFNRNYAVELRYLFNPSASLNEVLIPVYSTDPLAIIKGLQLELEASSGLEILGIEGGKLPGTIHQNAISGDKVLIAWDHPQAEGSLMFSSVEEPLFYIRMGKEESNLWPDEVLNLTEIRMPAAVIDSDFEYRSVQLVPVTLTTSNELYSGANSLILKARPNPFGDQVTIDFRLPSTSAVSLSLLDVSGQEIYHQTLDGKAGWDQVLFDRSLFPGSGVYFLKVCTNDAVQVLPLVCQ